ncbi:MAG: methyltransferase domain-containing protein [Deltaproteobacteria bacterium]|nr:methyltransferase domain-containing protein [Deltaproteobacteria bacterium]
MPFIEARNHYIEKVKSHALVGQDLANLWSIYEGKTSFVDLGCGNGHFLSEYLKLHPEMAGLGVDKRFKRIFKTAEKLQRNESLQSRVIFWDVPTFVQDSPAEFWDEVWMQFPDPWPKDRHEKHRMVTKEFFQQIYRILKPGGRFCFRSDCRSYWEFFQIENSRREFFPIVLSQKGDLFETEPKTLFQRRFLQAGVPIYSLQLRK